MQPSIFPEALIKYAPILVKPPFRKLRFWVSKTLVHISKIKKLKYQRLLSSKQKNQSLTLVLKPQHKLLYTQDSHVNL